jgi:peptidyl-tRNA hydrolase
MAADIGLYLEEIFCELPIGVKKAVTSLIIEYVDQNWSKLDQTVFLNLYKSLLELLKCLIKEDEKSFQRQLMRL